MRCVPCLLSLLSSVSLLAACGGGGDDEGPELGPTPPPARGSLLQSPPTRVATTTVADLLVDLGADEEVLQLFELVGTPKCGVDVHALQYATVGVNDISTTASGALMVPTGNDPDCQGARPIVLYAHGTSTDLAFDMTDLVENGEALVVAVAFAAQGYIVVAPDYAGYNTSTLGYHPYLHADQQSKDMIDALTAARSALPTSLAPGVTASNQLFVTGYSQGGHVAMATHRALQAAGTPVTASAPMSGPYALAAFGDAVFQGNVNLGAPVFSVLLAASYQRAYGNLYAAATDMFEARYATGIDTLLPSATPRSTLYAQGLLPQYQMFSSTPPDPAFASITPPTLPADRVPLYALGFGTDHLVTNGFRLAYLQDAQTNPDGGYPTTTTGLPAASPANTLRQAFKTNDLRNWTPAAPVLLCGGNADPTVFYLNTQLMQGYWAGSGAPVTVLDVDSSISGIDDPYAALKVGFATSKALVAADAVAQGATDGGAFAVADAYHDQLVPVFCMSAVRSFFDAL